MRLNQITLMVTDFERAKAFYLGLGLKLIVDSPPRYARFMVPGNEATLSIEMTPEARPMGPGQSPHIYFECEDLDVRYRALVAKGFVFHLPPTDMRYLWREAHLRDPDGHDLRLFWAGENRLNPPWRVKDA